MSKNLSCSNTENETIVEIKDMIEEAKLNDNLFYQFFKQKRLPLSAVKKAFQQYYYYIRTFPQILAGLSHRVDNEVVRKKLARTVVSELGDRAGKPHFAMFEDVLASVGITLDDWRVTEHESEALALVQGLRELFLEKNPNYAIGAHYVIEEAGLPMIVALYEGFRLYSGWNVEDYCYFYLHILVESSHVDWIADAVCESAKDAKSRKELVAGAQSAIELLNNFWLGMHRVASSETEACLVTA